MYLTNKVRQLQVTHFLLKLDNVQNNQTSNIIRNILVSILVTIVIGSCKKGENQLHDVSGYLYIRNEPIASAEVTIDGMVQYNTTSDDQGYFKIQNVSAGNHKLSAYKVTIDSSFIEASYDIDVNTNLILDSLLLPNPVKIVFCSLDSLSNEVTISWNRSVATDFREYKLYSHYSSGLDETTGTLEHVSTEIGDTTVILKVASGTQRFFRVFVMNDFGRLGGSNIKTITGVNINLLTGGDFEDESQFFSSWQVYGNVYIIDTLKFNGNKCLFFNGLIDTIDIAFSQCRIQSPPFLVEKNMEYELSFWYKARGLAHMMMPLEFNYTQDNQTFLYTIFGDKEFQGSWVPNSPVKRLNGVDWTFYSISFIPNNNSAITFYLGGTTTELYFDDLQIKRKL